MDNIIYKIYFITFLIENMCRNRYLFSISLFFSLYHKLHFIDVPITSLRKFRYFLLQAADVHVCSTEITFFHSQNVPCYNGKIIFFNRYSVKGFTLLASSLHSFFDRSSFPCILCVNGVDI